MNTYYFVSTKNFDGQILYPKVPENRMNNEDDSTERICVSKSINGCLSALSYSKGDKLFVHSCNVENQDVYQPDGNEVEDACYTGEEWILKPVKMEYHSCIEITKSFNFVLGNMPMSVHSFKIIC